MKIRLIVITDWICCSHKEHKHNEKVKGRREETQKITDERLYQKEKVIKINSPSPPHDISFSPHLMQSDSPHHLNPLIIKLFFFSLPIHLFLLSSSSTILDVNLMGRFIRGTKRRVFVHHSFSSHYLMF